MASNYPGSLDSLTNPTATDTLNSATVPHAEQHANANDAIEAIEATLGINPQGSSATVVARLNTLDSTVVKTNQASTIQPASGSTTNLTVQATAGTYSQDITARQSETGGIQWRLTVANTTGVFNGDYVRIAAGGGFAFDDYFYVTGVTTTTILIYNFGINGTNYGSAGASTYGTITKPNNQQTLFATKDAFGNVTATINPNGIVTGKLFVGDGSNLTGVVKSVSNGDNTITIGGTSTAPTVAVNQANLALNTSQITWSAITAWQANTSYAKGDLVEYQGVAYRRAVAGTSGATFNSANWQQITPTPTTSGAANSLVLTSGTGGITASGGISATTLSANTVSAIQTSGVSLNLGSVGTGSGNIQFGTSGGNLQVAAQSGGTGTLTLPTGGGTILSSNATSGLTSAANLATVGTITSGTWNAGVIQPLYGGTGSTYGTTMVGRTSLLATYTKAANDTTPEAVFRNSSGTIQYFNVDADTTYQFEGWLQLNKTATGTAALPVLSLIYVATGSTSTLTEQSARLIGNVITTTATIGVVGGNNANTSYTASGTGSNSATSYYISFRGHIRTNATTAGRINIGATQSVAGSSVAPDFILGAYLSVAKLGSGNTATFGNWTS